MEVLKSNKSSKVVYAEVPEYFDDLTNELMEITINLQMPKKS